MNAQLSLIDESAVEWDSDSYETPDWLARKMADLVMKSDRRILEPAAGSGQIAKHLPPYSTCFEVKQSRIESGLIQAGFQNWHLQDFLSGHYPERQLDLIITNPPFSKAMQFIERGLQLLDRHNPDSRLLYLLPGDTFASKERNAHFQALDCHIRHRYEVVGRVAYLKQGVPQQGRQIQDAVFDIRPGKAGSCVTFI